MRPRISYKMCKEEIMKKINAVCVYCGTGSDVDPVYKDEARKLGELLAKNGIRLVYGGGKVGLMGIVSSACFQAGGEVTGIIPEHIQDKEIRNTDVTELFVVDSMHTRKRLMVEKSDAFIVLPGGMGTLDETFEILTWKYLRLHDKPVAFVNVNGFYTPLLGMVEHMVSSGFTPSWHKGLYHVAASAEGAVAILDDEGGGDLLPDTKHM